jgi:hypothetical protein
MNQDTLDRNIRKFLKQVGITSQAEIENAVRAALASGQLSGNERLRVTLKLEIADLGLLHQLEGEIALQ